MNKNEWKGYDLEQIRIRQAETAQKIELEKERIRSIVSTIYSTNGKQTSNMKEMAMATSDAFLLTRYGIRTLNTIKKIINIYNNLRK